MHRRGITFVLGQTVAGVLLLQHLHFPVAGDLGEDRRGADRLYPGIALHHRLGGPAPIRATVAVYQYVFRFESQAFHRTGHSQHGGLVNIDLVNFRCLTPAQAPGSGLFEDLVVKLQAAFFSELLGIGQALDGPLRVQDHRRSHHCTNQRATAHFINPGQQPALVTALKRWKVFCGHQRRRSINSEIAVAARSSAFWRRLSCNSVKACCNCSRSSVFSMRSSTAAPRASGVASSCSNSGTKPFWASRFSKATQGTFTRRDSSL